MFVFLEVVRWLVVMMSFLSLYRWLCVVWVVVDFKMIMGVWFLLRLRKRGVVVFVL